MCSRFSSFYRRPGLTLIEVVTALALLSTLLVSMLVAFKKNAERIRTELAVREAVAGVDELLLGWARQGIYAPARSQGALPGVSGLSWETRILSRQFRNGLGLDIVSLRVHADNAMDRSVPLIAIELPVPASSDQSQGGTVK